MVRDLTWCRDGDARVRTASFERRSRLRLELLAGIARTIGETASRLIVPGLHVDVFPPVVPGPQAWHEITRDALLFPFHGERLDATLTIERSEGRRIAARALGEVAESEAGSGLSKLELRVIERFAVEVAAALEPLCGKAHIERGLSDPPCEAYVEMRIRGPLQTSLGIAFAREPEVPAGPRIAPAALDGCALECVVRLGVATISAGELIDLCVGDLLSLDTKVAPSATLNVGAYPVAAGEGGVLGDRSAFMVRDVTSGAVS